MKFLKISMLLLTVFIIGLSINSNAQYVQRKTPRDSAVAGTKYIIFNNVKKGTTGFQLTVVKKSGTLAGTITLERRIDTLPTIATAVWKQVGSQSFTITNITTPQGDIFPTAPLDGASYRFKVVISAGDCYTYPSYLYW